MRPLIGTLGFQVGRAYHNRGRDDRDPDAEQVVQEFIRSFCWTHFLISHLHPDNLRALDLTGPCKCLKSLI